MGRSGSREPTGLDGSGSRVPLLAASAGDDSRFAAAPPRPPGPLEWSAPHCRGDATRRRRRSTSSRLLQLFGDEGLHPLPVADAAVELDGLGLEKRQYLTTIGVVVQLKRTVNRLIHSLRLHQASGQIVAAEKQLQIENVARLRLRASRQGPHLLLSGRSTHVMLDGRRSQSVRRDDLRGNSIQSILALRRPIAELDFRANRLRVPGGFDSNLPPLRGFGVLGMTDIVDEQVLDSEQKLDLRRVEKIPDLLPQPPVGHSLDIEVNVL